MRSASASRSKEYLSSKSWPVAYRWLAVGTVVIYTAVGSRTVNVAMAQGLPANACRTEDAKRQEFDIPPGTFELVLKSFENATGLHVKMPDTGMLNLASPGVSGVHKV